MPFHFLPTCDCILAKYFNVTLRISRLNRHKTYAKNEISPGYYKLTCQMRVR